MINGLFSRLISMFVVLFILGLVACNDNTSSNNASVSEERINDIEVTDVGDFGFMFNDTEEGGMINFRSNDITHCGLVFIRSKLVQGYTTRVTAIGEGTVGLSCLAGKYAYAMTDRGDTYVNLTVVELGKTAVLNLDFSLYSGRGKDMLTRDNITLFVNEKQLETIFSAKQ